MSADHEALVLEAAAAILRARGDDGLADRVAPSRRSRAHKYAPADDASVLQRRLYEKMVQCGHNAFSLANAAGCKRDVVRFVFSGRSKDMTATNMVKIAKELGTSAEWLLGMDA